MWRSPGTWTSVFLLLALIAGVSVAFAVPADAGSPSMDVLDQQDPPPEAETPVWIRINLTEGGDANWSIEFRFELETDDHEAAFNELVEGIADGTYDPPMTLSQFESYRDLAVLETDRPMELSNDQWNDRIDNQTGILEFEFQWSNFARTDDDRMYVDDVFTTEDGTWFPTLDPGYRLDIRGPPESVVVSSPIGSAVENGLVTWDGPHEFDPGELSVTFMDVSDRTPTPTTPGPTPATPTPTPPASDGPLSLVQGAILAVGLGVILLLAFVTRRRWVQSNGDSSVAEAGPTDRPDDGGDEPPVDPDLLSDEERITRLLDQHGGRMKQATIVDETGWSNAKVSQLLSRMAEDGDVEKLRLGRENIISLPEFEEGDDSRL